MWILLECLFCILHFSPSIPSYYSGSIVVWLSLLMLLSGPVCLWSFVTHYYKNLRIFHQCSVLKPLSVEYCWQNRIRPVLPRFCLQLTSSIQGNIHLTLGRDTSTQRLDGEWLSEIQLDCKTYILFNPYSAASTARQPGHVTIETPKPIRIAQSSYFQTKYKAVGLWTNFPIQMHKRSRYWTRGMYI